MVAHEHRAVDERLVLDECGGHEPLLGVDAEHLDAAFAVLEQRLVVRFLPPHEGVGRVDGQRENLLVGVVAHGVVVAVAAGPAVARGDVVVLRPPPNE